MNVSRCLMQIVSGVSLIFSMGFAQAGMPSEVAAIQDQWAEINYRVAEDERADAMEQLVEQCDALLAREPEGVEGLIWCGIVNSSYAGLASPFSAMKYAKAARAGLEKAIEIDADALAGSACTSLGALYFKVPGWPVGFGNKGKASDWLQRGLAINKSGIDSNYFYAELLYEEGELEQARQHLETAQKAAPRPGREVADEGRRQEIEQLMATVDGKLAKR